LALDNLASAHALIGLGKTFIGRAEETEAHVGDRNPRNLPPYPPRLEEHARSPARKAIPESPPGGRSLSLDCELDHSWLHAFLLALLGGFRHREPTFPRCASAYKLWGGKDAQGN
jgi:hypothetical protein